MITQEEFQQRRVRLAQSLPERSIALIPSAMESIRNGDTHYRFHQSSDFYYLTGFNEPEALLIVLAGSKGESYLFNRPHDAAQEQWTGSRLGQEGACQLLGMQNAFPFPELTEKLAQFFIDKDAVFYSIGSTPWLEDQVLSALKTVKSLNRRGIAVPFQFHDLQPVLGEMRLIKSSSEIALMKKAAEISVAAHLRALFACKHKSYEYELEAEIVYELMRNGCKNLAYEPIVGSGKNACILHYNDNDQPLKKGDLVLIDAAGEYQNYSADITRTFPINGQFTKEQRAIYELVLKAQTAGIACIQPGIPWNQIQDTMVQIITEGLCELGLLTGEVNTLIEQGAYKRFYMHSSGHWLGLDVHDCGRYKIAEKWRLLEPGMVLTVEPGVYIREEHDVDPCWWNIGVRIEDDILVTETGHENLTAALPVEAVEIEALMRE